MTEINEKYVIELLKKKGIRLYEEEISLYAVLHLNYHINIIIYDSTKK